MVDHGRGLTAGAWSPSFAIPWRGANAARRQEGGLQPLRKGCEGLLRIGLTGTSGTAEFLEGFDFLFTVRAQLFVHRTLRRQLAGLRVDEDPALLNSAIARRQILIAIAFHKREHGLRIDLS